MKQDCYPLIRDVLSSGVLMPINEFVDLFCLIHCTKQSRGKLHTQSNE